MLSVLSFFALYRIAPLLDQLIKGLQLCDVLKTVRAFPGVFAPLFTFSGNMTVDDILGAIHVDESEQGTKPGDSVLLAFLKRFIQETNENGIVECVYSIWTCNHNHSFCVFLLNLDRKSFMRHVTGTTAINKKGIKVCFMEDEHGAITA